uniref:G_PROTEIN_RECEP_F1_2 domain-containing protein n=1 Tax=Macrostomum lignano TaxID=282301 RepID=A0A1I8FHG6_9PLAT
MWVKSLCVLFYSIICMLGTLGNLLVITVVLRKRSMQTITNILITNLAISDHGERAADADVCKLMPMTMGVSVYVSTLTSTAIAVERYCMIVHPFVPRMKTGLCLLIVVIIWLVAVLISLPIAVFQRAATESCVEDWKPEYRPVFTVISFVLQFLIPCSIITACYSSKVSISLKNRHKKTLAKKSRSKEELDIRRKRRTNRMLIAMVVIFVVCWIPLNLLWMLNDPSSSCATLLAMSSVMYNPFLYGWMNANFQNEFRNILPCLFPKRPPNAARSDSRLNTSYRYSTVDKSRQRQNGGHVGPEDGIQDDNLTEDNNEATGTNQEAAMIAETGAPPQITGLLKPNAKFTRLKTSTKKRSVRIARLHD